MSNINKEIMQQKFDQLNHQRQLQINRDMNKQRKTDTRRKIIIGGIIIKYFPELLDYQPRRTEAENYIEFERLETFVSILANDKCYIEQLKRNMVTEKLYKPLY